MLPPQTLQAALFGICEKNNTENVILYHLFLIFKLYVYHARKKGFLNVMRLMSQIIKIKEIE